jgi:uncharacterized membrane protein
MRCAVWASAAVLLELAGQGFCSARNDAAAVRAVLFASPTCSHCAKVIEQTLPPLAERYGPRLQVAIISTATPAGRDLFLSACMRYGHVRMSVPLLIVGDTSLVGSEEIPQKFPDLIEKHLSEGGIDWPPIPGFKTLLAENQGLASDRQMHAGSPSTGAPSAAPVTRAAAGSPRKTAAVLAPGKPPEGAPPASSAPKAQASKQAAPSGFSQFPPQTSAAGPSALPSSPESTASGAGIPQPAAKTEPAGIIDLTGGHKKMGVLDRILMDPYGNGLAILVLAGMLMTLLLSLMSLRKPLPKEEKPEAPRLDWATPVLTIVGMLAAAYLAHVEVLEVEAVCGPVGDCNTVQQSEYARLFGVIPIGLMGLFGYLAIYAAWMLRRWVKGRISLWASVCILVMTALGTLFSAYLTFLEPFVIGASCLWCLSSAVIMTTLYALAFNPGRQALSVLGLFRRSVPKPTQSQCKL